MKIKMFKKFLLNVLTVIASGLFIWLIIFLANYDGRFGTNY